MEKFEVRPPWPDEIPRLQHFLPAAFLFDPEPFLLVAASGRVERFVAALSMTMRPLEKIKATWLCVRIENDHASGAEMLRSGLDEAWARGAASVYFGQTVEEKSETARQLQAMGFATAAIHEVYEVDSKKIFERLERIRARLAERHVIPSDIEITTLQPSVLPKVREFLIANLPESASMLALETAGYKAEHSIALVHRGELKGVMLCRRAGKIAHIGLRVVAEELRSGLGWANLILLHASLVSGLQTGLEISRFEFDPELHHDTKQFAVISGARPVKRRLLLRIDSAKAVDHGAANQ